MTAALRTLFALIALSVLGLSSQANAQSTLLQGGPLTGGHVPMYVNGYSPQPIVQDSGPAAGGGPGVGLSELNITARGTGTAPYAGAGTGPDGTTLCDQDAPTTNSTGYHFLCFSANALGGGLIDFGAIGSASQTQLLVKINGVTEPFPLIGSNSPLSVPTNLALRAFVTTGFSAGTVITANGFYVAGDMPPVAYIYSSAACPNSALYGAAQVPATPSGCWLMGPQDSYSPLQWGTPLAPADGNAQLTQLFAYLAVTGSAETATDWSGNQFASSLPLFPKNTVIQNGALLGLAGASWSSTSGLIDIPNGNNNVTILNFSVDGGTIANIQDAYVAATSNITLINDNFDHWTTGGNGITVDGGKIAAFRVNSQQCITGDACVSNPSLRYGWAMGFIDGAADSNVFGGNLDETLTPLYVDNTSHHLGFSMVHFYNGGGGTTLTNPSCGIVNGYAIDIADPYIDSCQMTIGVSGSSRPNPSVTITGGRILNNTSNASLTSYFVLTTSVANSNLGNFAFDDAMWTTNSGPPLFSFTTTGSGSWAPSVDTAGLSTPTGNVRISGNIINFGSNLGGLGFQSLNSFLDNTFTPGMLAYTATQTDTGGMYVFNNTGGLLVVTLPNNLTPGWRSQFITRTISPYYVTFTAASGATLNGVAGGSVVVPASQIGEISVMDNPTGTTDDYIISFPALTNVFHQPTGNYTLAVSDCGSIVNEQNGTSVATVTIPVLPIVAPQGCDIKIIMKGSAAVTVTGASGTTVNATGAGSFATTPQYGYDIFTADGAKWTVNGHGL